LKRLQAEKNRLQADLDRFQAPPKGLSADEQSRLEIQDFFAKLDGRPTREERLREELAPVREKLGGVEAKIERAGAKLAVARAKSARTQDGLKRLVEEARTFFDRNPDSAEILTAYNCPKQRENLKTKYVDCVQRELNKQTQNAVRVYKDRLKENDFGLHQQAGKKTEKGGFCEID
jgi:septal ring factor EnvC (AmiA/AmiB activator)